jgi:methyl-accepting chemotaxis protein
MQAAPARLIHSGKTSQVPQRRTIIQTAGAGGPKAIDAGAIAKRREEAMQRGLRIKANKDMAKRTAASFAVVLIFLIFVFATPSYQDHPNTVILFGTLLVLSVAARVAAARSGHTDDDLANPTWIRNYSLATTFMALVWAGFLWATFVHYKSEWVFLLLVLSTAGIASAATSSLAPNPMLARVYVNIMVVPIIFMGLAGMTRVSLTLSGLLSLFVGALQIMIRDSSRQLMGGLSTIEKLNWQKADLEGVVEEIGRSSVELKEASTGLSTISGKMSHGAGAMSAESARVAELTVDFTANAKGIADAMRQLNEKTNQMAHSIDGMTSAFASISQTTQKTKSIAQDAARQAQSATQKVSELGKSAQQVGKITEAINEISAQTNMLALNATIEAARAGEAGRGFSVVANEIKALANQTAEATLQIKQQIDAIQTAIGQTVSEIDQISRITAEINQSSAASADSVAEQTETTKVIAASVVGASEEITAISADVIGSSATADTISAGIAGVSAAAGEVAASSAQVDASAETLMRLSGSLNEIVAATRRV